MNIKRQVFFLEILEISGSFVETFYFLQDGRSVARKRIKPVCCYSEVINHAWGLAPAAQEAGDFILSIVDDALQ